MKNFILTLIALTTISQAQTFLSLDVGSNTIYSDDLSNNSGLSIGAKYGNTGEKVRAYFSFNYFDEEDLTQYSGAVAVDYIFTSPEETLRPYVGLTLGFVNNEFLDNDNYSILYGAQTGLIINIDPHFAIDISAKYQGFTMDDMIYNGLNYSEIYNSNLNGSIGLIYKF